MGGDENKTICMVGAAQRAAQKNGALKLGGRPPVGLDMVLDALLFRLRNAGPWRDLPEVFGSWRTFYSWY
jgi:transposase